MVKFENVADLKRQPVQGVKGFPVPMAKQMQQPVKAKRKLKFPSPKKIKV